MGVDARDVVRTAKRLGTKLRRGDYDRCAVGMMARRVDMSTNHSTLPSVAERYKLSHAEIRAVECGFEGYPWQSAVDVIIHEDTPRTRRYYKVGQNIHATALKMGMLGSWND